MTVLFLVIKLSVNGSDCSFFGEKNCLDLSLPGKSEVPELITVLLEVFSNS